MMDRTAKMHAPEVLKSHDYKQQMPKRRDNVGDPTEQIARQHQWRAQQRPRKGDAPLSHENDEEVGSPMSLEQQYLAALRLSESRKASEKARQGSQPRTKQIEGGGPTSLLEGLIQKTIERLHPAEAKW